jgi:hypothetical protein
MLFSCVYSARRQEEKEEEEEQMMPLIDPVRRKGTSVIPAPVRDFRRNFLSLAVE